MTKKKALPPPIPAQEDQKVVVQLFTNQPKITKVIRARLAPHLSGWNRLSEMLLMDTLDDEDLKCMILIERERKIPRPAILRKLVARLVSRTRNHLMKAVLQ